MTYGISSHNCRREVERGPPVPRVVRIGLGMGVFLLAIPIISLSSDYAAVDIGCLTNLCFSGMLAAGAALLPRPPKKKVVVVRPKN